MTHVFLEATAKGVLQKKLILEILQYSQEKTCVGVSFPVDIA